MDLAQPIQPVQAIIRCKAKQLLIADLERWETLSCFDEALFQDLATTMFRAKSYQKLVRFCRSKQTAAAIEDRLAIGLAVAFKRIKQRQRDPLVQRFNQLLAAPR